MADDDEGEESPLEEVERGSFVTILRYVVLAVFVAFIAAIGFALLLGIPILRPFFGHEVRAPARLSALAVQGGTVTTQSDPVGDILNAIVAGIVMVINAIFQGIVAIFGTIASVVAAVITAIIMAPINFFSAAWNAATATLSGFGIGAPVAMIFVIIAVFAVLGIGGFLLVRGVQETAKVVED